MTAATVNPDIQNDCGPTCPHCGFTHFDATEDMPEGDHQCTCVVCHQAYCVEVVVWRRYYSRGVRP